MVQHRMFAKGIEHLGAGDIDFASDTIKYALLDSNASPNLATNEFFNDLSGDEVSGSGYTAGGATLASKTVQTIAASAVTAWASGTGYVVGDIVRPAVSNGHIYLCVVAGTSAVSEPTWATVFGRETEDNNVVWTLIGDSYLRYDAANPTWTSSTITARYGVAYVAGNTPGTNDYLIALLNFDGDESSSNGTFEVQFDSTGIARAFRAA